MVSFEIFVKAIPPSLSELKVLPSFCFAFKIPDDVAVTTIYFNKYAFSEYLSGQNWLSKMTYYYHFLSIIIMYSDAGRQKSFYTSCMYDRFVAFNLFAFVYNFQVKCIFAHQELFSNGLFYLLVLTGMYILISMHFRITFLVKIGSTEQLALTIFYYS